ncbi:hypothetical protein GGQ92_002853 [Gracilibacillus halotolerans]|uniref:DUF1659 domain-containing protein n=1 Tax=Gracilibacillus halotolerans TaxID=74386 RepID=A0A841RQA3_9BACI|nr:DUF1659 domain-containing protein [Gracilibacillus halotolerans]MBB6514032.1 hypothetical protein [Gracilibacillus halotolerans]
MASTELINSRLQLIFENGTDPVSGNPIYKTKSFNNIKLDATADQLMAVTKALVPLQQLPLNAVRRNATEQIVEG